MKSTWKLVGNQRYNCRALQAKLKIEPIKWNKTLLRLDVKNLAYRPDPLHLHPQNIQFHV